MFLEFPKGLCKGGASGEWLIVFDEKQEAQAREDGFIFLGDVEEKETTATKRGRPPKAKK